MKYLLLLYPIQPYVDALIGKAELPETKVKIAKIYQRLILKRYPGFQLVCVMFSESRKPANPDVSQLWKGISIGNSDIVGSCGVSFDEHRKKRIYPRAKKIIALCPKPIDVLVVGGLHLWDCVDKTAKYAYKQGINVFVDEDLTELFFFRVRNSRGVPSLKIPISREESLKRTRKQLSKTGSTMFLEHAREERKKRPWMAQI